MRKKIFTLCAVVGILTSLSAQPIFAQESSFEGDGSIRYIGTSYVDNKQGGYNYEAKMDVYKYTNLRDENYIAGDIYFRKKNASGTIVSKDRQGYGRARFERGTSVLADSGRVYGISNIEVWSEPCANWLYTGHVYGAAVK